MSDSIVSLANLQEGFINVVTIRVNYSVKRQLGR